MLISIGSVLFAATLHSTSAHATPWLMDFPVIGNASYTNDYDAYRSLNGVHRATDIFAAKHSKVVSPVDGVITWVSYPQPSWGWYVQITDYDGFQYNFIHLNNDTPGTDNGSGGAINAYAPDVKQGYQVKRGQHIGYVGDSGNAENTPPHLHFEIYDKNDNVMNPYDYLNAAYRIARPNDYPQLAGETLPYGPFVKASTYVASGNFDIAQVAKEYVVVTGAGNSPHVQLLASDKKPIGGGFMGYAESYRGGLTVTAGDFNNDGIDEIVTGTGAGNSSNVRIRSKDGVLISEFMAYPGYYTGVTVATGDFNNDGIDEIVTGTGAGNSTHIKVFDMRGVQLRDFFAYPGDMTGVDVSVGDVQGDAVEEIIVTRGPGASSYVKIFDQNGVLVKGFDVYGQFSGGTRVDVANVLDSVAGAKSEIVTSPWNKGGPDIRVYDALGGLVRNESTYEVWWSGQFDVAADKNNISVSTGDNRRSSLRSIDLQP